PACTLDSWTRGTREPLSSPGARVRACSSRSGTGPEESPARNTGCEHEKVETVRVGLPAGESDNHQHVQRVQGESAEGPCARYSNRSRQSLESRGDALSHRQGFQQQLPEDAAGELARGRHASPCAEG